MLQMRPPGSPDARPGPDGLPRPFSRSPLRSGRRAGAQEEERPLPPPVPVADDDRQRRARDRRAVRGRVRARARAQRLFSSRASAREFGDVARPLGASDATLILRDLAARVDDLAGAEQAARPSGSWPGPDDRRRPHRQRVRSAAGLPRPSAAPCAVRTSASTGSTNQLGRAAGEDVDPVERHPRLGRR